MSVKDLIEKGDGVLVRTHGVWSYPGAPIDQSAANLRLPVDHVSDAEVQQALAEESVVVAMTNTDGSPLVVRLKGHGPHRILSVAQAGTAEAGTELPVGASPPVDAGADGGETSEAPADAETKDAGAGRKGR
jgi:hypothetical protein